MCLYLSPPHQALSRADFRYPGGERYRHNPGKSARMCDLLTPKTLPNHWFSKGYVGSAHPQNEQDFLLLPGHPKGGPRRRKDRPIPGRLPETHKWFWARLGGVSGAPRVSLEPAEAAASIHALASALTPLFAKVLPSPGGGRGKQIALRNDSYAHNKTPG